VFSPENRCPFVRNPPPEVAGITRRMHPEMPDAETPSLSPTRGNPQRRIRPTIRQLGNP